jgi:hypothetical protein
VFIRQLVHGVCLALSVLTSEVIIKKKGSRVKISFICHPLRNTLPQFPEKLLGAYKENSARFTFISSLLRNIISEKLQQVAVIEMKETPFLASNPKILTDWVQLEINKSPHQHQRVLKQTLLEFQKVSAASPKDLQSKLSKSDFLEIIKKEIQKH